MSNNYRFAKRGNNGSAGQTGSKPSTSKGTASPVAGVDRLDYGHDNNFVCIRQQLARGPWRPLLIHHEWGQTRASGANHGVRRGQIPGADGDSAGRHLPIPYPGP
jgi:hypothetical protein